MISPAENAKGFRWQVLWVAFWVAGAAFLAVTNRSFWIDECFSAELAKQPTLADCWRAMRHFPEVQLPFYMLYLWTHTHLFGDSEWILRAAGIPWFVAGATAFPVYLGRTIGSALIPALLVSWSAFAWYYLNEARVYCVQLGIALALVGAAVEIIRTTTIGVPSRSALRYFLVALFLLCGTSVLAAVWGAFLLFALLSVVPREQWLRWFRLVPASAISSACALAALAAYYVWTMGLNAKPTAVGTTNPQTMVYVFYELLGLAGWGAGRNELRDTGVSALKPFFLPLAVATTLTTIVFVTGLKQLLVRFGVRRVALALGLAALPFLLICVVGMLTRFRVLGRHATPLLPVLMIILGFGVFALARDRRWVAKLIAGGFLLSLLGSSLCIRFAERHQKDDYRGAAAFAKTAVAAGQQVWWNADQFGAAYYRVGPGESLTSNRMTFVANPSAQTLREWPEPNIVIISKPDVYDNGGAVAEYVRQPQYRLLKTLPTFTIWTNLNSVSRR